MNAKLLSACLFLGACGQGCLPPGVKGTIKAIRHDPREARGGSWTHTAVAIRLANNDTKICFTGAADAAFLEPGDTLVGPFG